MTMPGVCDYCGQEKQDLMPSFWNDRTRWFCDLNCLGMFKSVAIGSRCADEALDGAPGTAKKLMEKMKNDAEKANGAVVR